MARDGAEALSVVVEVTDPGNEGGHDLSGGEDVALITSMAPKRSM